MSSPLTRPLILCGAVAGPVFVTVDCSAVVAMRLCDFPFVQDKARRVVLNSILKATK
jgi:hypothetical protein